MFIRRSRARAFCHEFVRRKAAEVIAYFLIYDDSVFLCNSLIRCSTPGIDSQTTLGVIVDARSSKNDLFIHTQQPLFRRCKRNRSPLEVRNTIYEAKFCDAVKIPGLKCVYSRADSIFNKLQESKVLGDIAAPFDIHFRITVARFISRFFTCYAVCLRSFPMWGVLTIKEEDGGVAILRSNLKGTLAGSVLLPLEWELFYADFGCDKMFHLIVAWRPAHGIISGTDEFI